jgi:ABC-type branched-subunit amino acid transport system ATPase component/ABC-type branched-subunit amino acid transport system permease subunit
VSLRPARSLLSDLFTRPAFVALMVFSFGWVYFAPNYWIFTIAAGLTVAFNALGLTILVGWGREVSLAQAGLVGTAVFVGGWLYRPDAGGRGWPFVLAILGAVVLVTVMSASVALASVRLSGVYVMVLTLGLQFLIERIVFSKGFLTGGFTPLNTPRPWFFGISLESDRAIYFFLLGILWVTLLLVVRLRRSHFGRALVLVGTDRRAAAALGVSPWRYKVFAFALCGILAGLSGALSASLFGSPPSAPSYFSFTSLFYLSIPVLAGAESLLAVVFAGVFFSLGPQAFESFRINAFILGGLGLVIGTVRGPRGIGGDILEGIRKARRRAWRSDGLDRPEWLTPERRSEMLSVLEAYLPPRPEADVALVADGVSINFGGVQALRNVSVTIPTGRFVGLIGPNGAGKSTLFDVVNGLKQPNQGTVALFGKDVTGLPAWDRARLGMSRSFQAASLNLDLPVSENILAGAHTMIGGRLPGLLAGLPRSWATERRAEEAARAVAELLEIGHHWHERTGTLSFGNRRRVEIARSLMAGPRLLLLDEPAAGLDPRAADALFGLVRQLHEDLGLTVLLVEHYVRAVLEYCDHVYVLAQGQLVTEGSPRSIADHPDVRSQYFGSVF